MNARTYTSRALTVFFLTIGAAILLLPFFWMVSLSLKTPEEIFSPELTFFPGSFYFDNYIKAFQQVPLHRFLLNGVMVCGGILFFQMMFAVPCAYALAQRQFAGRTIVFGMVLAGLLVPYHVTAVPIFLGLAQLQLLNTYAALVLPFVASVFGIFLFRQFMATLPPDLIDAARVDGLSEMAIVWRIAFPAAWPAATTFAIFSIVAHWNDLFWPMIVISDADLATPPQGILFFRDEESGSDVGPLMAAATVVTTPLVLLFLIAQRWFIQGVTMSGIKG
ncbi:carbohydrate ABC transporter permease [Rhodobacteraceae bacterium RKSG542]|uniref:carbohydrate ABC transporter permease n=1 Tax=Pseudovibrio flavus TaxID=2529854 RepID=UPI0012BCBF31|nr:carbohydrate ABC transporter permease [Pseudovibrio flavus]MTI15949.1 carbohydrate ABC transporter permease [Pseudovibrio flavus]